MHTFFRQRLSMSLLSTAVMLQGISGGGVHAQQGEIQANRPIRLTPATKRPAEPRRLTNTVTPQANTNTVAPQANTNTVAPRANPNLRSSAPTGVQAPQAGPIPVTGMSPNGVQQTAGPQSGEASRSGIQQQLDEMYRKQGLQAPQMNYNSLPQTLAGRQQQGDQGEDGEDEEEGQQPSGPQQRAGSPSQMNGPVRGGGVNGTIPQPNYHQPPQQQQQQQEYKEPNLLKRWFGPRKKPEQQQPQVRPQQFPQQGMNRAQGGANAQKPTFTPAPAEQTPPPEPPSAQVVTPPQQPVVTPSRQPVATPSQQPVATRPAQPGRATLDTSNLQRSQAQQQRAAVVRQQPATPRAPASAVVPVQTPAQAAQPAQETETPAAQQPAATKGAPAQEEEIPRLDDPAEEVKEKAPVTEAKPAATPATPAKKSPFENLEIYEPEQSKPAAEAQPSAAAPETKDAVPETKEAAREEQPATNPPLTTPAAETPVSKTPVSKVPVATPPAGEGQPANTPASTPAGKTSMQDLQTRPQAVLFLDGEDDEQREKYRMLAAFPEMTGFKGFCPTVLRDERDLVRGRKSFQLTHHKHVYLFSSAKALVAAQANPEKYLPMSDGQDVVLLKEGENVDGSVDAAAWYRGRLYLFASRKNLEIFAANPTLYTGTETVIQTQPQASKHPLKTEEKPAEVSDDEESEEEEMEEKEESKAATPTRNQSPASMLNGPGATGPKSKGSANPVPPPPANEESSDEPAMPGKKIKAAKFSEKNPTSDRKRTVLRVSVPAG